MKMSIQNQGDRRISIISFAGLFLFAVMICCTAFAKAVKLKKELPQEELALLVEKEKILADFSMLSKALCKFDNAKRADSKSTHQNEADAKTKKVDLYQKLLKRDTSRIYRDVLSFMRMADQYYLLIEEMGKESDERIKAFNLELINLRKQNELLLAEKNQIQTEKAAIELEKIGMQNELNIKNIKSTKSSKGSGSSGGATAPVIIPNSSKDCTNELERYKGKVKLKIALLQEEVRKIQTKVKGISCSIVGGKKSVNKTKTDIEVDIIQLKEKMKEIGGR